jgi:uncharacterized protein (DUF1800 family)
MADGREVLDLIASHPATARHLAQKLCQRLLGPNPPETLITKAAELWLRKAQSEQQIAEVVRLIVLSPEFLASAGRKVRRPLSLMASFMRALDVEFIPTLDLGNQLANAGQKLFGATTPVGLPDENALFIGTNAMRQRFNLIMGLAQNRWKNGTPDSIQALQSWGGRIDEGENFVSDWFSVFGSSLTPVLLSQVIDLSGLKGQKPRDVDPNKLVLVPALAAMAPAFQKT